MSDVRRMQIGHIVDFVITYNERQRKARPASGTVQTDRPKKRKATQADINAFFG